MTICLTDTGYPTGIGQLSLAFRDYSYKVLALGDNLDAPDVIISGGVFFQKTTRESLPAMAHVRGRETQNSSCFNSTWVDDGIF